MKKIIFLILLVILTLSVSMVSAAENITDDAVSLTPAGDSFDDIQKTINNAKNGDVIELDGNYNSNKKIIDINREVTIQSSNEPATLDGKKQSKIFNINADKVTLKNLIIKNSLDSAIDSTSDKTYTFTIVNCTFVNNGKGWDGGVIFNTNDGVLNIINSTFTNNQADFGGAIYSVRYGEINIVNSKFTANQADEGGAIYATSFKKLTVTDSSFSDNKVAKEGGAIDVEGQLIEISSSTFENNVANFGGAVCANVYDIMVKGSIFTKNTAKKEGGAIYTINYLGVDEKIDDNLVISDSVFDSNTKGYAVYSNVCNVKIENSSFKSNSDDLYLKIGSLINNNNTIKTPKVVNSPKATLSYGKTTLTYDSWNSFKVLIRDDEGNVLYDRKVKVTVGSGSNKKVYYASNDLDSPYVYFRLSKLPVGKYKVTVSLESKYYKATAVKTTVSVKKAKTTVKAKKITARYKKSGKFTIKVRHKLTEEPVKKIKIKIKVYTGNKYKKYIVKTNKKGVVSISTKKLKRGYHKVVITSKNKNYDISKISSITIK